MSTDLAETELTPATVPNSRLARLLLRCFLAFESFRKGMIFSDGLAAVVFFCTAVAVAARGFGDALLFKGASAAFCGAILFVALARCRAYVAGTALGAAIVALVNPAIIYLYGFQIALAALVVLAPTIAEAVPWTFRTLKGIIGSFLVLWLVQSSEAGSWLAEPGGVAGVFTFIAVACAFSPRWLLIVLAVAASAVTATELARARPVDIQIGHNDKVAPAYRHGKQLQHVIGGKLVPLGSVDGDLGISNLFFPAGNRSAKPVFLVEHDVPPSSEYPAVSEHRLTQPHPWHNRQFVGNQYLLYAIARDGAWVSNLGGSIRPEGHLLLASLHHEGGNALEPIVIQYRNALYVQDSDMFVDRLVPYARNALRELIFGSRLPRLVNILFILLLLLPLASLRATVLMATVMLHQFSLLAPESGAVRLVTETGDPHEMSAAFGVPRSLIDAGFDGSVGQVDTRLLVVGRSRMARVREGEHLVLAASGARVAVDGNAISVGDVPLGVVDGIVDARELFIGGVSQGVKSKVGNVTVIGTDSPAKQSWKELLK